MTASDQGLTAQVARFVTGTSYEMLPPELITAVKRAWIDTTGVTLAGAREESGSIARRLAELAGAAPEATIIGMGVRSSAPLAALANGVAGHALDYDDMSKGLNGHPSVPLVPAVLAIAESTGCGGKDAVLAFAVGYEVTARLGASMGPSSYARGWHATSVVGTLGAAAAVARLLDLDEAQTRHALGIATSMASGSRQNFGSMTKPLHAGLAARAGVEAATLASLGFTADERAIEAPLGFGALYNPADDWQPERITGFGDPWDLLDPGLCVKQYPCCYNTHLALDAAFKATGRARVDEAAVESIEVRVMEGSTPALIHHRPATGLAGKFSMEYCVAAALLDGEIRLSSFEDEAVARDTAQSLLRRVSVAYSSQPEAQVTVRFKDGRRLEGTAAFEHGSDADPLSWDELVAKYRDCASLVLTPEAVERSLSLLTNLEELPSMRELAAALCP